MRAVALGMVLLCGIAQGAEPNSIGMELIEIPAGEFMMGSPLDEQYHCDNEKQVAVTLTKPFWLGKTEVTQGQFKKVMGTKPWRSWAVKGDKDCPATYVSWEEAKAFCDELTELDEDAGKLKANEKYSLPTEAQWEYACRAGTTTAYSFADDPWGGEYAWFHGNAMNAGEKYAHKVGLKKPNPWGLYDMHGNVSEWCSDWKGEKLSGGTDPVGPEGGSARVARGGSWRSFPALGRSANRFSGVPKESRGTLGFRVARSQSAQ